jgi:hypothetical protein
MFDRSAADCAKHLGHTWVGIASALQRSIQQRWLGGEGTVGRRRLRSTLEMSGRRKGGAKRKLSGWPYEWAMCGSPARRQPLGRCNISAFGLPASPLHHLACSTAVRKSRQIRL